MEIQCDIEKEAKKETLVAEFDVDDNFGTKGPSKKVKIIKNYI